MRGERNNPVNEIRAREKKTLPSRLYIHNYVHVCVCTSLEVISVCWRYGFFFVDNQDWLETSRERKRGERDKKKVVDVYNGKKEKTVIQSRASEINATTRCTHAIHYSRVSYH